MLACPKIVGPISLMSVSQTGFRVQGQLPGAKVKIVCVTDFPPTVKASAVAISGDQCVPLLSLPGVTVKVGDAFVARQSLGAESSGMLPMEFSVVAIAIPTTTGQIGHVTCDTHLYE